MSYFHNQFAASKNRTKTIVFGGVMFAFAAFSSATSSHAAERFGSTPDEGNAISFTQEALMNARGASGVDYQTRDKSPERKKFMSCQLAYGSLSDFKQMKDSMMQSVHTTFADQPQTELDKSYVIKTAYNAHLIEMSFASALYQTSAYCPDLITLAPQGSYDGNVQSEAGKIIGMVENKGACQTALNASENLLDKVLKEGAADTTPMYQQKSYMTALIAKAAVHERCNGENWLDKMKAKRDDQKVMAQFSKRLQFMLNKQPTR